MKGFKSVKKLVSCLVCYILFVTMLPVNVLAVDSSKNNIMNNNSVIVKDGEWIYYRNSTDGGCIYKIKTDGTGNTKINNMSSSNISIHGEWIYFKTIDPNDSNKNYNMLRIKKNGSQDTLQDLKFKSDNEVFIGDYIYYVKNHDGIYKVKADGSQKPKKIVDCIHGGIRKNYIFYEKATDYFIADLDGKNNRKVGNTNDIQQFTDEWIYQSRYEDGLYRTRIDGTETSKIDKDCFAYVINDNWIYTYDEGSGECYIKKIDGSKKIKESGATYFKSYTGDVWQGIKMIDNWICFEDMLYNSFSMVNVDSGKKVKLYKNSENPDINLGNLNSLSCLKDGDYVYYIEECNDGEQFLYKYNINSNKMQKISPFEEIQKVSGDKNWTVKFNNAVDPSTINDKTIFVTDGDNKPVGVSIKISDDGKSITISKSKDSKSGTWQKYRVLNNNYTCGKQIYNLKITNKVKDKNGKSLKKNVITKFEVK